MYISDLGIKIYLKKIKFGELRDETINYHLQIEAKMLRNYAMMLLQMLTNEQNHVIGGIDEQLGLLEIDPELKSILYECIHAQDKINQMEQEQYDNEVNEFILKEKIKRQKLEAEIEKDETLVNDYQEMVDFKKSI